MKVLERGSILIAVAGFIFKINGRSGGNELVMIGLTLLALVYFYLGFALLNDIRLKVIFRKSSYAQTNSLRIVGAIGIGVLISCITIGILFKLLLLMGAHEMLTIGVVGLVVTLFAEVIVFTAKNKKLDSFYYHTFVRGGIAVVLGTILYLMPVNSMIRFYHRNDPDYAERFIRAIENPNNKRIQKEFEEARERKYK